MENSTKQEAQTLTSVIGAASIDAGLRLFAGGETSQGSGYTQIAVGYLREYRAACNAPAPGEKTAQIKARVKAGYLSRVATLREKTGFKNANFPSDTGRLLQAANLVEDVDTLFPKEESTGFEFTKVLTFKCLIKIHQAYLKIPPVDSSKTDDASDKLRTVKNAAFHRLQDAVFDSYSLNSREMEEKYFPKSVAEKASKALDVEKIRSDTQILCSSGYLTPVIAGIVLAGNDAILDAISALVAEAALRQIDIPTIVKTETDDEAQQKILTACALGVGA